MCAVLQTHLDAARLAVRSCRSAPNQHECHSILMRLLMHAAMFRPRALVLMGSNASRSRFWLMSRCAGSLRHVLMQLHCPCDPAGLRPISMLGCTSSASLPVPRDVRLRWGHSQPRRIRLAFKPINTVLQNLYQVRCTPSSLHQNVYMKFRVGT